MADGDAAALPAWNAAEREDFLDAIARHRRAAWRVTFACTLASTILAVVASLLLAPLLYCVMGLVLDVLNIVIPMPDLLGFAGRVVGPYMDSEPQPQVMSLPSAVVLAMLPGWALIYVAARVLSRALRHSPLFHPDQVVGRAPDAGVLAEQRFRNTVEEMAIAANIPVPRVEIIDGGANAAAFGPDDAHATVLIGSGLVASLDRDEMQGVAGHLVSSIADGDMRIGMRTALTLGLFALYARMGSGFGDKGGLAETRRLILALVWPSQANAEYIQKQLSEPFAPSETAAKEFTGNTENKLTWQQWAMMPLAGPVIFAGFMCGLVSTMMLSPMIALAWRQRKYMADAAAVRLTRNPDGVAGALLAIAQTRSSNMPAWAAHLSVVDAGTRATGNLLGGFGSSIAFPSIAKRHKALERLGATRVVTEQQSKWKIFGNAVSLPVTIFVGFLLTLAAALMCVAVVLLVWVSVAMTMLFTVMPAGLIHMLLRH